MSEQLDMLDNRRRRRVKRAFKLQAVEPLEGQIQNAILRYLKVERRVAWAERFNTGAHVIEGRDAKGGKKRRFVRYAFPGCADILGQLADGRFLAIEVKTRTGRVTPEQQAFLDRVDKAGGLALVARSLDDVREALK